MKAVIYHKKGSTRKLIYGDVGKPVPKDNGVDQAYRRFRHRFAGFYKKTGTIPDFTCKH